MSEAAGHALRIQGLTKRYGNFTAVDTVSLDIERGEFLTLLGPSGSGKTTILMAVAGFVLPNEGSILLDGNNITALPPERRNFGMVFQGYALFPHMSVAENVAFPLRVRGLSRAARDEKVRAALDLVQLSSFAERLPRQLSGGQQQRVALARALVFDPALLLLDEPLSALDKKLRAELQEELKSLHRRVGRTFINVTHDQEEALSLSDRIAILNHGRLIQHGPAAFLYENPRTRFVADFLGKSNFIQADLVRRDDHYAILRAGTTDLRQDLASIPEIKGKVLLSLRPERIRFLNAGEIAANEVTAHIRSWSYLGSGFSIVAGIPDLGDIRINAPANHPSDMLRDGATIRLGWDADAAKPVLEDE